MDTDELTLRLQYLSGYYDALRDTAPRLICEAAGPLGMDDELVTSLVAEFESEVNTVDTTRDLTRARRALARA